MAGLEGFFTELTRLARARPEAPGTVFFPHRWVAFAATEPMRTTLLRGQAGEEGAARGRFCTVPMTVWLPRRAPAPAVLDSFFSRVIRTAESSPEALRVGIFPGDRVGFSVRETGADFP